MDSDDKKFGGDSDDRHFEDKWPNMPLTHGRNMDAPFLTAAAIITLLLAAFVFYLRS